MSFCVAHMWPRRQGGGSLWSKFITPSRCDSNNPDGHPNSPTFGHLKLPHLN